MKLFPTLGAGTLLTLAVAQIAEAATPSNLVDLSNYVHDLVISKPYATTQNFTGKVVCPAENTELVNICKLESTASQKLQKADIYLKAHSDGDRLLAWDCYRPVEAQQMLWNANGCITDPQKCSGYVAAPGHSKHNYGHAFDGSLADKNGAPLEMPTHYDSFSSKAHPGNRSQWSQAAQINWDVYDAAMTSAGCTINPSEWWHADC